MSNTTSSLTALTDQKVLVTGGRGFLGTHLVRELKQHAKQVDVFTEDIRDIEKFSESFDTVFHLAALTRSIPPNAQQNFFETNCEGTLAVLKYCHTQNAACIFASSAAVYEPNSGNTPLPEKAPLSPSNPYGESKRIAESMCHYYAHHLHIPVTVLRIFNLYGPEQQESFLIPYLAQTISAQQAIQLKTPNAIRDFIYVSDVVEAFVLSAQHSHSGYRIFNVGSGTGHSVLHVVEELGRVLEKRVNIQLLKSPIKNSVVSDSREISKALQWKPKIDLKQGLRLTVV